MKVLTRHRCPDQVTTDYPRLVLDEVLVCGSWPTGERAFHAVAAIRNTAVGWGGYFHQAKPRNAN